MPATLGESTCTSALLVDAHREATKGFAIPCTRSCRVGSKPTTQNTNACGQASKKRNRRWATSEVSRAMGSKFWMAQPTRHVVGALVRDSRGALDAVQKESLIALHGAMLNHETDLDADCGMIVAEVTREFLGLPWAWRKIGHRGVLSLLAGPIRSFGYSDEARRQCWSRMWEGSSRDTVNRLRCRRIRLGTVRGVAEP